jgi:signal transduction histidine kinase
MTQKQGPYRTSAFAVQRSELGSSATSCARWIRAATGGESATVRVAVPDDSGRLRVIASEGQDGGSGRLRSRRRRSVFRNLSPARLPLQGSPGLTLVVFPLVSDGTALGVVEIVAPTARIEDREDVLVSLIAQSALVLNGAGMRGEAEWALAGMSATLRLASDLMWARTPTEAVRHAVSACSEHLGGPIVGLLPDRDGWGWFLAASDGLGAQRRTELRETLRGADDEPGSHRALLSSLRLQFRNVTRSRQVVALQAGIAILLLGDMPARNEDFLERVGALLEGVLKRVGAARPALDRVSDLGIAWTAHELKGPLLGAAAALDRVTETGERLESQELLRRTKEELRHLSGLIDPLLRWSTGGEALVRRRVDLVQITREAVASLDLELDTEHVLVEAPDQVFVDVDFRQLRSAIANVVRNALTYSPTGAPVIISIESSNRLVRVIVRDRGPGIPVEERDHVFDPFSRGHVGRSARAGSGLGLFIARRVLEAHGGTISLWPSESGATFVLEFPSPNERRERSAS